MIKITRNEFLTFVLIPDIANAKEVNWFKSNKEGDKLGIIIQLKSNHKYDYLIFRKDTEDYILYPHEHDSSEDYKSIYGELKKQMFL